jgi:transcriptional regulator with XRE-family HTH domain
LEATSKSLQVFVGAIVRTLREELGWSQEELASRAKTHPNEISLLERAKRNSTLRTLERVAKALDVSCSQLLWQAEMLRKRVEREEAKMKE